MQEHRHASRQKPRGSMASEYSKRKSPFSIQYSKALFESPHVEIAGRDAVLLTLFIVAIEDKLFYSKAPAFWRAQLMDRRD